MMVRYTHRNPRQQILGLRHYWENHLVVLDPTDVIMCNLYSELSFLQCHQK
jgi:hypothetical protein